MRVHEVTHASVGCVRSDVEYEHGDVACVIKDEHA